MSSYNVSNIVSFKADAAIAAYSAVKAGSDSKHVAVGSANTSKCIGIAMSAATAAEDVIEVAVVGGGCKVKLGENVSFGDMLVSHTDGTLVIKNSAGDRIVAMAMEDGSSGDVICAQVVIGEAQA